MPMTSLYFYTTEEEEIWLEPYIAFDFAEIIDIVYNHMHV